MGSENKFWTGRGGGATNFVLPRPSLIHSFMVFVRKSFKQSDHYLFNYFNQIEVF
jgi:hypothetical protein